VENVAGLPLRAIIAVCGFGIPLGDDDCYPRVGRKGALADSVAFSPNGKILAAAAGADDKVWLWSLADLARPARHRVHIAKPVLRRLIHRDPRWPLPSVSPIVGGMLLAWSRRRFTRWQCAGRA
jgi:WD40 repeat protein